MQPHLRASSDGRWNSVLIHALMAIGSWVRRFWTEQSDIWKNHDPRQAGGTSLGPVPNNAPPHFLCLAHLINQNLWWQEQKNESILWPLDELRLFFPSPSLCPWHASSLWYSPTVHLSSLQRMKQKNNSSFYHIKLELCSCTEWHGLLLLPFTMGTGWSPHSHKEPKVTTFVGNCSY